VDVAADTYAYTAWFNSLSAMVPPWAHDGGTARLLERLRDPAARQRMRRDMETPGSWENNAWKEITGPEAILIGAVQNPKLRPLQGKTLAQVAKERKSDPITALLDLLVEDNALTNVAVFGMAEPDVVVALQHPWVSINNDSEGTAPDGLLGQAHPHPRAYGTFPRILRKYVREEKRLTLEDAIRKFTSLAAQRMRLDDRGVLKAGMWADVVVFDPALVRDRATFDKPNQLSEGMQWVLVNGVPVIAEGKATNALPGKVLRGRGFSATGP
jgi:N-acyl-D-amino-acid deacylase